MASRQQVTYLTATIILTTLASLTVLTSNLQIDGSRLQGARIKKLKGLFRIKGLTEGEGPLTIGFCHALSAAEVAEALVADPQSMNDVPAAEQGNRHVFPIGNLQEPPTDQQVVQQPQMWQTYRFPWKNIQEGTGLFIFAFNRDNSALTTGATIDFEGVCVYDWLED